jgi:hypothetical protein
VVFSTQKGMDFDLLNTPSISFPEIDIFYFIRAVAVNEVTGDRGRTYTQGRRKTKRHRRIRHYSVGLF